MQQRKEYRDPRPGEVSSFLSTHAEWVKAYGKELRFRPCPKCRTNDRSNPATQVNGESGLWRCFHCDTVGNWYTLTREFGSPLALDDRYHERTTPISPTHFETFFGIKRRPVTGAHYIKLLDYCHFRGFTDQTLNAWRVSTKGPSALRWPLYGWDGKTWAICNARIRVCINKETTTCTDWFEQKGGPTGLLLGNHLLDYSCKRVLIFEGQWDAMSGYQIGFKNCLSLPNGATGVHVASMLRYVPDDFEVWLSMDHDEAGDKAVEKFFAQLGPERVARLHLPTNDLNEWLVTKPDLTVGEVEATAKGLTTMTSMSGATTEDGFVKVSMDEADQSEESLLIASTPWPGLNDMLNGGFKGGETTGLLAPSGMGKTTMCNQMAIYAAKTGTTVGLLSLEGTRSALKRKIKDCIRGSVQPADYRKTADNLLISPLEGTQVTTDQCIAEFEGMVKKGARLLIFDNLDFITRDKNGDKIHAYGQLIDQARRYNLHTLVVWQPNKVDRNAVINSGNQKGYSQTFQDSDNYINLNPVEDFVQLEVEKAREVGVERVNNKVWLIYDKPTRCFSQCTEDIKVEVNTKTGNLLHLTDYR